MFCYIPTLNRGDGGYLAKEKTIFLRTKLDQDQPEVVKNQRKLELQQRQESYKWGTFAGWEGLSRHLEAAQHSDIPRDSQFSQEARNSIDEDRKKAVIDLGLAHLSTVLTGITSTTFKRLSVGSMEEDNDLLKATDG